MTGAYLVKRKPEISIALESGEVKLIREALIAQATNAGRIAQIARESDKPVNISEHWQYRESELMRIARMLL